MNVGVREAATQLDLNPSTVSRQVKSFVAKGLLRVEGGKFDLEAYKLARAGGLNPLMARGKGGDLGYEMPTAPAPAGEEPAASAAPKDMSLIGKAHAADKVYAAQLKQLDLAKRLGKVVDLAGVLAAAADIAEALRDGLRTRNRRIAEKAATLNDPNDIEAMLDREDEALLAGLRAVMAKGLAPAEEEHAAA